MKTIGVDVGGTFTDLVLFDEASGALAIEKVATTPEDPSIGVLSGIAKLCEAAGADPAEIEQVFHGTTIATNAVLEHKGGTVGMITNDGFRDILHIARHQRVEHYSIRQELPWQDRPLVRRRHRKTVPGRLIPPTGAELIPLDEDAVRTAAEELRDGGVDAVVICFLFSYLNPAHETRAAEIVRAVMPDAFVTTSATVSPQFREFERFTTAAMAAFVGPKVGAYVHRLDTALKDGGITGALRIMGSNGGVSTPRMTVAKPATTLLSGLVAGVIGGAWVGERIDRRRLITFDIGGTSADIGIVVDGVFAETDARSSSIAGFPLLMPMLDIHTIGAGGGSIAHVDAGGAFGVGPQSAGAVPGPAAYGKGGREPTVTDANLVLGRLDPDGLLGGTMTLDLDAARTAMTGLADRLGLSLEEAAEGVLTVINANMANAIRSRTVQKGIDPRDFALVAFGGAGPLHGAAVAAMLGIPEVIIPPYPGITSAMGLLITDLKYDAIRTAFQTSDAIDLDRINRDFAAMDAELNAEFSADGGAGADGTLACLRAADMRYVGQGYELKVPVPDGPLDGAAIDALFAAFHSAHEAEYGHAFPTNPVEIVNLRLTGTAALPRLTGIAMPTGTSLEEARLAERSCLFRTTAGLTTMQTAVYRRDALPEGAVFEGPAIVLQHDSTTVVPPGATCQADPSGGLLIRLEDTA